MFGLTLCLASHYVWPHIMISVTLCLASSFDLIVVLILHYVGPHISSGADSVFIKGVLSLHALVLPRCRHTNSIDATKRLARTWAGVTHDIFETIMM
jgi:hypothetical protein